MAERQSLTAACSRPLGLGLWGATTSTGVICRYWGAAAQDVINQETQDYILVRGMGASHAHAGARARLPTDSREGEAPQVQFSRAGHLLTGSGAARPPPQQASGMPAAPLLLYCRSTAAEAHPRRGADQRQRATLPQAPPPTLPAGQDR